MVLLGCLLHLFGGFLNHRLDELFVFGRGQNQLLTILQCRRPTILIAIKTDSIFLKLIRTQRQGETHEGIGIHLGGKKCREIFLLFQSRHRVAVEELQEIVLKVAGGVTETKEGNAVWKVLHKTMIEAASGCGNYRNGIKVQGTTGKDCFGNRRELGTLETLDTGRDRGGVRGTTLFLEGGDRRHFRRYERK